ncbi:MAG: VWA domain-containing protein [Acidimicrobiia bacterium]|nr:VWA domain-containing protein [Acidimicrobiia bacterium]
MVTRVVALLFVAVAAVPAGAQEPAPPGDQPPTFRTGVDLVTIDVAATDSRGQPVRNLRAPDFVVKVNGRERRVVSAQHVHYDVAAMQKEFAATRHEETFFTTNIGPSTGRMILIAVDQGNIRPGAVRQLLRTAAAFVDGLAPTDQVAFVAYPAPGPEVSFTTDRLRIRQAMEQVVGMQRPYHAKFNIGLSEAIAIHDRFDETVLKTVVARECRGLQAVEQVDTCQREVMSDAAGQSRHVRDETDLSLQGLQMLLRRLAIIDGHKTIVLISEGLVLEDLGGDAEEVARLAARARAGLNVLLMDVTGGDVLTSVLPPTPAADRAMQTRGLEDLAVMSRGTLYQVIGTGRAVFDRLASELSGYYVLGVEESAGDRDERRYHRLDVEVRRQGVTLRSHRAFVVSSAIGASREPRQRLVDALSSPFSVADVPLRVTSFAFQDHGDPSKVRVAIAAEVDQPGATPAEYEVGYVMFDREGVMASSGTTKQRLTPVDGRPDAPLEFLLATSVDPGVYTLRFGVVDASGRRGSVVRDVNAWRTEGEEFAVGDLMIGNVVDEPGQPMTPQLEPRIHQNRVGAYLELYAADPASLDGTSVSVDVAEDQNGPPLVTVPARFYKGPRPNTVIAQTPVSTDALPPGRYVARVRITRNGTPRGALSRPFILEPSAPSATSALLAPADFTEWVPKFSRDRLVQADFVAGILDLLAQGTTVPAEAMTEARAGRFGMAALEALTAGDESVAAFLKGLDLFLTGQPAQAATQFNAAAGPRREHFPSALYLGASLADAGRDADAAGVWQLALASLPPGRTLPDAIAPVVYTMFADARLRTGQASSVVDVLEPMKGGMRNADVYKRLGLAYVMTGRYEEALPVLRDVLSTAPADQEAIFAIVLAQYQVTSRDGVPIPSGDLDELRKHARAYKGAQRALVNRYLDAIGTK